MNQKDFSENSFAFNQPSKGAKPFSKDEGTHRLFNYKEQRACWNQARVVIGRHPDRWRFDGAGNPVMKVLHGCSGAYCYQYDHIVPFSKGGRTVVENCQILQSKANLRKGAKVALSMDQLKSKSLHSSGNAEMDMLQKLVYGDIRQPSMEEMYKMMLSKDLQ